MTKKTTEPFRYDLIPEGSAVLCALSGGEDSMYLLCRLLEGAEQGGYTVRAAHYNHHLRLTADRDEQFVRDWCAVRGIPLTVGHGDVAVHAAQTGTGIEEAARDLRYTFLREAADAAGCALIATGHHAVDNAETILMNLIRGCGGGGLSGIPERRGNLIRPMLSLTKEEVRSYLSAHGIPHVEDETNGDLCHTRNRVRHQLLPLLEELNPRAVAHITDAARRVGEDDEELRRQAELLLVPCVETEEGYSIPVAALTGAPRPVALRALMSLAPGAQAVHLTQILALCQCSDPSARLDIPGCTVCRAYGNLLFLTNELHPPVPAQLQLGSQTWGGWHLTCTEEICPVKAYVSPEQFYVKIAPYLIRPRREGDLLQLGRRPRKTVKKLMIEHRIPRHLRSCVPVLEGPDGCAAVGGLGPHWDALAQPGSRCLKITIRKGE